MKLRFWTHSDGKPDLPPADIERLIVSRASEASLLHYQEAIGRQFAAEASSRVREYTNGFARHTAETSYPNSGVVDVLGDVADIIKTSQFPAKIISLRKDES